VPDERTTDLADDDLLRRSAAGDQHAFESFLERHQGAVYRYLRARTGCVADCEDALQETFLAVYRGCEGYRGEASARAWVLGIARNVCRRLYRKRVGEPDEWVPLEEFGLRAGWGGPAPSESFLERLEQRDTLEKALTQLTPEEQEVLVLRDLEGLSGEEAADLLDLSVSAMKSRLHRARLRLAAVLTEVTHG
jgi:RNA polymerase sigma-70 factor (ECF subfamily)